MKKLIFISLLLALSADTFAQNKGILLEDLTWQEAEKVLKAFERYCSAHGAEESGEDETGKEMSSLGWEA